MKGYQQVHAAIKKNKKYAGLADSIVQKEIVAFFKDFPEKKKHLVHERSEAYKKIIREIRGSLHKMHGSFQTTKRSKRVEYLEQLATNKEDVLTVHENILATNRSTKERLPLYPQLYKKIFAITGKPKTILDLGCGLNPFSFPFMELNKVTYYAYDIDESELADIQLYFRQHKQIEGKVTSKNLQDVNLQTLPRADIAFVFKAVDPIERGKGHKWTERLLKQLPAKWIIISFATKTVSGKAMNYPRRRWIEMLLQRLHLQYELLVEKNELFYLINTHKKAK